MYGAMLPCKLRLTYYNRNLIIRIIYRPSFVSIFDHNNVTGFPSLNKHVKQKIRRTPSAPLKFSPATDLFRGSQVRCDIPMYSSEGIELLGYSRIGTIHAPRNRSGSDPSCSVG